jgi:hypothetical protein
MTDVTRILSAIEQGESSAAENLMPIVCEEMRKLAAGPSWPTRSPAKLLRQTALVHEALIRLVDVERA